MNYVISIEDSKLTAEEFISLIEAVGWGKREVFLSPDVEKALKNSSFIVTVRSPEGKLLGCGRALSDDFFFTTIPDIFVLPEEQNKGIGSLIMEKIKERYGHTVIYFGAQNSKESFYEKLGFKKGMQSYTARFKTR